MTNVFQANLPEDHPQTHILVIGVGNYPYLMDGTDPRNDINMGFGQISSPPFSAAAFAKWFIDTPYNNPDSPLGTIDILLSPTQTFSTNTQPGPAQVDNATMDKIKQAVYAWYDRCDKHEGNVAIFYFCGHGIAKDIQLLLTENFCENRHNRWEHAINFTKLLRGMKHNKAYTQCYFIDACREITPELMEQIDVRGDGILETGLNNMRERIALPVFATAAGRSAFGEKNSVSYFTKALIDAFDHFGAKNLPGSKWGIRTDSLGGAISRLVEKNNLKLSSEYHQRATAAQGEHPSKRVLHYLSETPKVEVDVSCLPPGFSSRHHLFIENNLRSYTRPPEHGRWQQEVEAGYYAIGARETPDGNPVVHHPGEMVVPPDYEVTLEGV